MSENTPAAAAPAAANPDVTNNVVEDQDVGAEEALDAAAPTPEAKKEIQKQLNKYKLKIDNEESDFELDLSNDEEVKKHLQLSKVAQKRMAEAADVRKKQSDFERSADEFINLLKTDPRRVLSDPSIGVDLKKFAQDILNQEAEESRKSPEQRQIEKLQKQLQDSMDQKKQEEEDRKGKEFTRLQEEAYRTIDLDITAALQAENLPKKPYILNKFINYMSAALEQNIELSAKDLGPLIRKDLISDVNELLGAAPDEVIEEILGKDILGRMRKRSLQRAKQSAPPGPNNIKASGTAPKEALNTDNQKKIPLKDFLKGLK